MRQRRHVLAEVDGEIGRAIGLVRGDARARHVAQHLRRAPPPAGAVPSARSASLCTKRVLSLRALSSCHIQKAPFSPTTASTGQKRAI